MLAFTATTLLLAASTFAAPIRRAASATDVLVFQFAGVLEKLETAFYEAALAKFQDSDFEAAGFGNVNIPKELFSTILTDEKAHNSIIESTLQSFGVEPISTCKFDFGAALDSVAVMAATARVVENVGVSAYLGGANLLENKELLIAAASILTIEARHETVLNIINTASAIPSAFDIALSPSQVLAIAGGFISGCDLGIPANAALTVTNTGAITPGTKLTFESTGLPTGDLSKFTCQMMTGGAAFALALPLSDCVVPDINGPVYIFVVNGTQPLLNSQVNQASTTILAGPTLAFIDTIPETIGQAVKAAPATIESSSNISASEAGSLLQAAQSEPASGTAEAGATTTSEAGAAETASATESASSAEGSAITVLGMSMSDGTSVTP